jgi:hypothetical protein
VKLLSKLGTFLKTAIMATIADRHFHALCEASESPNLFDVPSKLPFSRNLQQTFEERKSNNSSLKMTITPTVALQGLRKLELTQQRVARIENFDALRDSDR